MLLSLIMDREDFFLLLKILLAIIFCLVFLLAGYRFGHDVRHSECSSFSTETLWQLINNYRQSQNLPVLKIDEGLCQLANLRAKEISNDWSHNGFYRLELRSNSYCPTCTNMGENLVKELSTPKLTMQGWLNSFSHKQILDYPYNIGCLGFYVLEDTVFVALELGRK